MAWSPDRAIPDGIKSRRMSALVPRSGDRGYLHIVIATRMKGPVEGVHRGQPRQGRNMLAHGASRGTTSRHRFGKAPAGRHMRACRDGPQHDVTGTRFAPMGLPLRWQPLSHGLRRGLACFAPTGLTVSLRPIDRDAWNSSPTNSRYLRCVDTNGRSHWHAADYFPFINSGSSSPLGP